MSTREIAVISGKGGTGKTTLVASIIPFLKNVIIADADVDAPDLNILFDSTIVTKEDFIGFQRPQIDYAKCIKCGKCYTHCNFNAITKDIVIKDSKCEGCTVCEVICPVDAITMHDYIIGKIYTRDTKYGTMVDARLIPGEESSGKLVTKVRTLAKEKALENNSDYILIDGSPGIACNVISAVTGVHRVVIVTEPTLSGLHDLDRVLRLVQTFGINPVVVINKCDIEDSMRINIKEYCKEKNIEVMLEIPFSREMVYAISNKVIPSLTDIPFFSDDSWINFISYIKD